MCIYFFVFALKIWRVSESFISLGKIFHIIGAKEDIDSVPYLTDLQLFECYTTLIVKELPCNKKIKSFTSISKTFITYITITVTNISNNIIKPYYGIIKLFQVLIIVKKKKKKKSLAELLFSFRTVLSRLIRKLSLISRIYF